MHFRLAPQLSSITLDHVLSGATCEPIGLTDFEAYLIYKEHTPENLRFIVWYQDYRRRFFMLPREVQARSPGVDKFDFGLPSPARVERFSAFALEEDNREVQEGEKENAERVSVLESPLTPTSIALLVPPPSARRVPPPSSTQSSASQCPPSAQPFRAEVAWIAATFLVAGAPQELGLPAAVRARVLHAAAASTHPCALLPAYEAAYEALAGASLPAWLRAAGGGRNIGRAKAAYWWAYGAFTSLVGWAIVLACLLARDVRREWRLWAVPFLCLGGMQMYAGYRGFCTQVWGRGGMQLQPWELVHPEHVTLVRHDAESNAAVPVGTRSRASTFSSTGKSEKEKDGVVVCEERVAQAGVQDFQLPELRDIEDQYVAPRPQETMLRVDDTIVEERRTPPIETQSNASPNFSSPPPPISIPSSHSHSQSYSHAHSRMSGASFALPTYARSDGYRDEWVGPPSPTASSLPFPPTPAAPIPVPELSALRRFWSRPRREQGARESSRSGEARRGSGDARPPLGLRARVFGPERVVLDPRIRAVHRRVMRDILAAGAVWGVLCTVVVLVLPHRR